MVERNPLYAYAVREDGALLILHETQGSKLIESKSYRIPVSTSKEKITEYGNLSTQNVLESTLVNITPLLEGGVLSSDSIVNLDM